MNNKKWLVRVVSLTAMLGLTLGLGIFAACTPSVTPGPDDNNPGGTEHTHSYTEWAHDDTQHWKVCPDDNTADESTKANHSFVEGVCECGATENGDQPDVPDANLDTRAFYVVGSGAGDLSQASFTELRSSFKLTKADKADSNGYTVYTIQFKIYYGGDKFKVVQDLDWVDGTYFGLYEMKDAGSTFIDKGNADIGVAEGKDGIYKFTVRTKPGTAISACSFEWELIESVTPPTKTEEMYIIGNISETGYNQWSTDKTKMKAMTLQADGKTWVADIKLGAGIDEFKVYDFLSKAYYPGGTNNNLKPTDGGGTYTVTWVRGSNDPTVVKKAHEHEYTQWAHSETEHWKVCPTDKTIDESTRAAHSIGANGACECGHTFTKLANDETNHWFICPTCEAVKEESRTAHNFGENNRCTVCDYENATDPDWVVDENGALVEYKGDFVNMTIPANLKSFGALTDIFGKSISTYPNPTNWNAVQSLSVHPENTSFKMEKGALLSYDGTVLYAYLPYNTATELTLDSVTTVILNAAYANTHLQLLSLPNATTIGTYAFAACSSLETVELEKVQSVGNRSFFQCSALKNITLGDAITEIGTYGFAASSTVGPNGVITIKATTPPTLDRNVFGAAANFTGTIYVPAESVEAYKTASVWSGYAAKIEAIPVAASAPAEVALLPKKED